MCVEECYASKGTLNRDVQSMLMCVEFAFHLVKQRHAAFQGIKYMAFQIGSDFFEAVFVAS